MGTPEGLPGGMPPGIPPQIGEFLEKGGGVTLEDALAGSLESLRAGEEAKPEPKEDEMTKEECVDFVCKRRDWADRRRKPHELVWDRNWDRYNSIYDFSEKKGWQSKIVPPRIFFMVEKCTAVFTKGLTRIKEWFSVKVAPSSQSMANIIRRHMKFWLDKIGFVDLFGDAVKSGFLSQMVIMRIGWDYQKVRKVRNGRIVEEEFDVPEVEVVNPSYFWIGKGWVIERTKHELAEFKAMVKDGTYDKVDELMDTFAMSYTDSTGDSKDATKAMETNESEPDTPGIVLDHYWGDISDKMGNLIYKNIYVCIANETYLVKGPIENPFLHGENPYVYTGVVKVPFSTYHKSLVGMAIGTTDAMTELLNMIIDAFTLSILQGWEINLDLLYDPSQLTTGLTPGKLWKKRGEGRLLEQAMSVAVPQQVWTLYQGLDRETQFSGLSEMMTGTPRLRGRTSAYESMVRQGESGALFDYFISQLEVSFMEKFLQKYYLTILQYQRDYLNPFFIESVPDAQKLAYMNPMKRYELLGSDTSFSVRSLSSIIDKSQDIEKLGMFTKIIGQNPAWSSQLKPEKFLTKIMEAFNWDAEELLFMPGEVPPTPPGAPAPGAPPSPGAPATPPAPNAGFSATSRQGGNPPTQGQPPQGQPPQGMAQLQAMLQQIPKSAG
jgi:hypothetical protein